jgi:hypothetical protein
MNPHPLWQTLEALPALAGTKNVWQARLGDSFEIVARLFLERGSGVAASYPCPRGCGCAHEVVRQHDRSFVAVCRCDPWNCDDIELTEADVALWQVNIQKLARAIATALGIQARIVKLATPLTVQLGVWSTEAIPVVFTTAGTEDDLQLAAACLSGSLRGRFILLVPTLRHVGVATRQAMAVARAGVFGLDSILALTRPGFEPAQAPGKVFHEFTPAAESDAPEEVQSGPLRWSRNWIQASKSPRSSPFSDSTVSRT